MKSICHLVAANSGRLKSKGLNI